MPASTNPRHDRPRPPSARETAAPTTRGREPAGRGHRADPEERPDAHAQLDRITGVEQQPDEVSVRSRLDARFLMDGDMFDRDGTTHVVDDDPIPHDGVLTIPTRAGDEATWVDVPDGEWVTLHDPPIGAVTGRGGAPSEEERRAQLAAWHADDQAADLSSGEVHLICGPDPVRER